MMPTLHNAERAGAQQQQQRGGDESRPPLSFSPSTSHYKNIYFSLSLFPFILFIIFVVVAFFFFFTVADYC